MALTKNSYGGTDLLATATDVDKRVTALEAVESRVSALEAELAAIKAALTPKEPEHGNEGSQSR